MMAASARIEKALSFAASKLRDLEVGAEESSKSICSWQ